MAQRTKREIPKMESIKRISRIPVVETGMQYARVVYGKIKNSNSLVQWSLGTVEGGLQLAIDKSLAAAPIVEMPLAIVDTIVCKSLDSIENRVPAINYPPELLLNMTKDLVSTRIVQPVIKRADSVKQFSVQGASKYGEIAASRLDTALDVADLYVDKYLPDATDKVDNKVDGRTGESKTIQTIEHVNRFSRKLQRRLTKRTIAEAKALKKQGADTVQIMVHLMDLAIKDPKQFAEKMKTVWKNLSEDEPENQVPPGNMEQLIAMLTRESARRFVHLTNYAVATAAKMPTYTIQTVHILNGFAAYFLDYINKAVNLDRAKAVAISKAKTEVEILYNTLLQLYSHLPQIMKLLPLLPKYLPPSQQQCTTVSIENTEKYNSKRQDNFTQDTITQQQSTSVVKKEKPESGRKKKSKETPRTQPDENSNSPTTVENGSAQTSTSNIESE